MKRTSTLTFALAFTFTWAVTCAVAAADDIYVKIMPVKSVTVNLEPKGTDDRSADFDEALARVRQCGRGEIVLAPGKYYLRTPTKSSIYISNHDNTLPRNIFLNVADVQNLKIRCPDGKARLLADGNGVCAIFMDTRNVEVENVEFDFVRPFYTVGVIKNKSLTIDMSKYPYRQNATGTIVAQGGNSAKGTSWEDNQTISGIFAAPTEEGGPAGRYLADGGQPNVYGTYSYPDGTIMMTRSGYRPNPGVVLYRAENTIFRGCGAFGGAGMGFLAQRSTNITLDGWRTRGDRPVALQADATHFSNCRGLVTVENGVFENTVDDAINVHSTALQITSISSDRKTITCQYMHGQSVGFEVFLPGERLRFIKKSTFVPGDGEEVVVQAATMSDATHVTLRLETPAPAAYAAGDAVENADWQPNVTFVRNIVRNNSPRGVLFTTPGKVICSSNLFENVKEQTFHFQGDAASWYESGASRDVLIEGNTIRGCGQGGGYGVFLIDPSVPDLASQPADRRYHRNILIRNNTFDGCKNGYLMYVRSASGVVFEGNKVLNGNSTSVNKAYADVTEQTWTK